MAFLAVFMAQYPFLAWPRKKSVKIIQTAEKIFQNQIPQNENMQKRINENYTSGMIEITEKLKELNGLVYESGEMINKYQSSLNIHNVDFRKK